MTYLSIAARLVRQHEGVRYEPYDDATGKRPIALGHITIGVGRNLEARPLTDDEVDYLLANDLAENEKQVRKWLGSYKVETSKPYPIKITAGPNGITQEPVNKPEDDWDYFDLLSDNRKAALLDLAHWGNIQSGKMLKANLLQALKPGQSFLNYYALAADEILYKDGKDPSNGPSGWYQISPTRAQELADIIETNRLPKGLKEEE